MIEGEASKLIRDARAATSPVSAAAGEYEIRVVVRVEGNQVFVQWDDNSAELIAMGFLEAIPGEFT